MMKIEHVGTRKKVGSNFSDGNFFQMKFLLTMSIFLLLLYNTKFMDVTDEHTYQKIKNALGR